MMTRPKSSARPWTGKAPALSLTIHATTASAAEASAIFNAVTASLRPPKSAQAAAHEERQQEKIHQRDGRGGKRQTDMAERTDQQ